MTQDDGNLRAWVIVGVAISAAIIAMLLWPS